MPEDIGQGLVGQVILATDHANDGIEITPAEIAHRGGSFAIDGSGCPPKGT